MSFLRKTISTVLVLVLLFTLCLTFSVSADSTSVRNRKIVSLVYDDSGSMSGEKWEYTSYALQCFAAMLNDEDKLDITYMSTYQKGSTSVNTKNLAKAVEEIRKHSSSGGTPADSIDTAFKALQAANDTNPNSQYWLIILTDGQMAGDETAEDKVNKYADVTLPNGTKAQIIYMTICDTNNAFTPQFTKTNVQTKKANTASEVTDIISDIACDISGRYEVDAADITWVDNKTVQVKADTPLTRMGVLVQRSQATISSVENPEGIKLKQIRSIPVALPMRSQKLSAEEAASLRGNVSLFGSLTGNIAADTYTIHFSEDIRKEDLVIMFEPAFELRLEVSMDGAVITDLSNLAAKQVVNIEAVLYETGTNNRIPDSMLPAGVQKHIVLSEGGGVVRSENGLTLSAVELKMIETRVEAEMKVPGFFTATDAIAFTPRSVAVSGITATIHYDGSERLVDENGNQDPENVVYVTDLDKNGTGVRFVLHVDNEPADKELALALKKEFINGLKIDFKNYNVTVQDDGSIIVSPAKKSFFVPDLIYYWLHKGDARIETTMNGVTGGDVICFKLGDLKAAIIDFLVWLLMLYLIFHVLYWIFKKPHFPKKGRLIVYTASRAYGAYTQNYGYTKRVHWLAASDPLNFFGLKGMGKRIGSFYVRASARGFSIKNVKGKYADTSMEFPSAQLGCQPCKKSTLYFASTVYIFDGTTYYRITFSR